MPKWTSFARTRSTTADEKTHQDSISTDDPETAARKPPKWSLGILQDTETDEVPGSVLLLSKVAKRNEPLGLQHAPARTSSSSLPSPYPPSLRSRSHSRDRKKKTANGKIVLEPQPDDSHNDPLNWPSWRRNASLLSLGFYCMVGGGMTPVLAAGFNEVAETFDIALSRVSLTTGLYMMGLGVGCVIMSPTAIQFGKRPVYLASCILFILSSVWCALSPNFASLIVARIFQGIAVSPVECLPSATIAEIFFLHERAYRLGIYTLLLLGGKNLIPLVSAAIIQSLGWRWVFWMVAIILGFGGVLLFFFVPETFWDRTPHARAKHTHDSLSKMHLPQLFHRTTSNFSGRQQQPADGAGDPSTSQMQLRLPLGKRKDHHVAFKPAPKDESQSADASTSIGGTLTPDRTGLPKLTIPMSGSGFSTPKTQSKVGTPLSSWTSPADWDIVDDAQPTLGPTPDLHNLNSPWYQGKANDDTDYFAMTTEPESSAPTATAQVSTQQEPQPASSASAPTSQSAVLKLPNTQLKSKSGDKHAGLTTNHERKAVPTPSSRTTSPTRSDDIKGLKKDDSEPGSDLLPVQTPVHFIDNEPLSSTDPDGHSLQAGAKYTEHYRAAPPKNYKDFLKPYHGRLSHDNWFRIAARPFILYLYPSILWASMVYALSVGWLIVLSESVSLVYKNRNTYNFDSIQTGLVYLSPFIGGVLGTAVAGRVSDVIVRFMARRNDGVYEPEFRLVMAIPIAITSVIGLMGFGWSAHERDNWFVPTFFFGVISFGCSLGSTTAITFAVDSYRQYAGEALVTLNFTKNIFHGLIFSLFFTSWLESDGSKKVFIALGCIQLACLLLTIPMYIYGKRARMWTVRKNLMEKF